MIEPVYKTIGKNIARRRDEAGMTQKQLGRLVGLSRECVSGIEHATQRCHVHTLLAIDDVLRAFE